MTSTDIQSEFNDTYSVPDTAAWINKFKFKMVALQFPDDLLHCSVAVTQALQSRTTAIVIILADTNYGSCCVDEVATERYTGVDAVVHYGHACLSPVRRLPVFYVFGMRSVDVESCSSLVGSAIQDGGQDVLLLYDVVYHHAMGVLGDKLREQFPGLLVPSLILPSGDPTLVDSDLRGAGAENIPGSVTENVQSTNRTSTKFNRTFSLPPGRNISEYTMLYVGEENLFLSAVMMTFNRCARFVTYDPTTNLLKSDAWNVSRLLMKRHYMVERVRDAARVGILVGTLGVENYLVVIRRLRDVIKRAGKKSRLIPLGKLNVAKLANFAEIDVFVLVACPENTLIDSHEMVCPVVTPYELELACLTGRQWTGDYEVDFRQLLPGGANYYDMSNEDTTQREEEEEQEGGGVSLVTGRTRCTAGDLGGGGQEAGTWYNAGALVSKDGRVVVHQSAGEFLLNRSWQGLEPRLGETPVEKCSEGASGIARGYLHEPNSSQHESNHEQHKTIGSECEPTSGSGQERVGLVVEEPIDDIVGASLCCGNKTVCLKSS